MPKLYGDSLSFCKSSKHKSWDANLHANDRSQSMFVDERDPVENLAFLPAVSLNILRWYEFLRIDVLQVPGKWFAFQFVAQHAPMRHIADIRMILQSSKVEWGLENGSSFTLRCYEPLDRDDSYRTNQCIHPSRPLPVAPYWCRAYRDYPEICNKFIKHCIEIRVSQVVKVSLTRMDETLWKCDPLANTVSSRLCRRLKMAISQFIRCHRKVR